MPFLGLKMEEYSGLEDESLFRLADEELNLALDDVTHLTVARPKRMDR